MQMFTDSLSIKVRFADLVLMFVINRFYFAFGICDLTYSFLHSSPINIPVTCQALLSNQETPLVNSFLSIHKTQTDKK